jgi:competence protein ComEC
MIYALFSLVIGGRRKIRTNVIIAFLLVAYAALAGFSPSVVRAVIMILLHIVSRLAHYRYDLVSAGCVTAALMLIWNPYQLFSAGFQMSFLAVMIMGFLMPVAENIKIPSGILKEAVDEIVDLPSLEKKKLSEKVKQLLLPPLVIQAGMLPLTVYQFNYLPLMAFFANIPVVFLAGIIVPAGVVMFVLCGLGILGAGASSFSGILVKLLGLITDLMIKINDLLYADGFASPDVVSPPLWAVLVFYSMMFFASSEWARIKWHRGMKRQWVAAAAIIVIAAGLGAVTYYIMMNMKRKK